VPVTIGVPTWVSIAPEEYFYIAAQDGNRCGALQNPALRSEQPRRVLDRPAGPLPRWPALSRPGLAAGTSRVACSTTTC